MFRTGIGYDIHRLVEGRRLILGGVEIPYSRGLDGHSDADVLLHAVCDALLGAIGAGDIGEHFADTDAAYKDISSLVLLKKVKVMMDGRHFSTVNLDTVILAQEPKIMDFKEQMRQNIAACLAVDPSRINIKATTTEKLGPIGQKEGIAAFATALVESRTE